MPDKTSVLPVLIVLFGLFKALDADTNLAVEFTDVKSPKKQTALLTALFAVPFNYLMLSNT